MAITSHYSIDQCEIDARAAVVDEAMRALALGLPRCLYREAMTQDGAYRTDVECVRGLKAVTDREVQEVREAIGHA
ncbi:hypothetical protein Z948_781 [Sulfitobacter donghicola DSW-25 = KCTC 12864 = JCM 14565]|nr:hypothetical protein Z948_781 [Sulfitobacter donghicola DSW-25 = KCTC 12864 = JCM 14565]